MRYKHAMILINGKSPAQILRERIEFEGTLPSGALKLQMFLNHQVDCALLATCGQHLAYRFTHATQEFTKILAPRSGVVVAQACAVHMHLPMVIAVTKPPMTSSPNAVLYKHTRPQGGVYTEETDLYVSSEVISPTDSVLILDDVLASGKTAAACADLVKQSGAKVKGCGFLIEKMYDGGHALLPEDALVVSVVRVKNVSDGRIEFCDDSS